MKTLSKFAASAALLVALSVAAHADYVKLKDGTPIKGEATSYDEPTKTLTFKLEDGTLKKYTMDELDGRSAYLVNRSRVPQDDAVKQLKLANFARDVGLYAHAVRHYEYAAKADPSKKPEIDREVAVLKKKAAVWAMDKAKTSAANGDKADAEMWLTKILEKLPDEPQAAEAKAMLDQYYSQRRAEKEAKAEEKASDEFKKDVAIGKKYYDSMVEKTKEGLTSKRVGATAASEWKSAIRDGDRVMAELDKLDKKFTDAATQETLAGYRKVVVEQLIEVRLHYASYLTTRSSYNDALAEVNHCLALDPKSEEALSARARIEQAASERGGWIW